MSADVADPRDPAQIRRLPVAGDANPRPPETEARRGQDFRPPHARLSTISHLSSSNICSTWNPDAPNRGSTCDS